MTTSRILQIALAVLGVALAAASVPALNDDPLLGVIGIAGAVLIVVGALLALRRDGGGSADER